MDTYRDWLGCSSLLVSAEKSATHGPLLGRNLDFYTLGVLDKYGLVTVHRPRGKHAFAVGGAAGHHGLPVGHERRRPGPGGPRGLTWPPTARHC